MGGELSKALRASWLPKITNGWFIRAESFFSVARYPDEVGHGVPTHPCLISSLIHTAKAFCVLLGMVPKATHLHLRQAEIGAITGAPDGIPEADAADRAVDDLPDRHGHALADADGVSHPKR
jgi:hypothetical protein